MRSAAAGPGVRVAARHGRHRAGRAGPRNRRPGALSLSLIARAGEIIASRSGPASSPRASSGFPFDPSTTLPWAVPALLIAPLAMFIIALSSVRTRRSASATAMFGTVVTLLLTLLVAWGLTRRSTPYVATYQYINLSVGFNGPTNFQTFAIELVLHVDHLTVAALAVIEICMIAAIGWNQVMGRA